MPIPAVMRNQILGKASSANVVTQNEGIDEDYTGFFKQKVDCDCQCVGRTITFVKTSQQLVCGQMVEYLTTIASNLCWKNVKFQLRLPGLVFY